jgi:mRNA interferase MazF
VNQREVWWAELPLPVGRRPVLLLSRPEAYRVRASVTVAQVTTTIRGIPVEVRLSNVDGVPKDCVANLDTIMTISKSSLKSRICVLSEARWQQVVVALKFAFDL